MPRFTREVSFYLTDEDIELIERIRQMLNLDSRSHAIRVAVRFFLKHFKTVFLLKSLEEEMS